MIKKNIFFLIFFFSFKIFCDISIFYPGDTYKSQSFFSPYFIFSSSENCSLLVVEITDFKNIDFDFLFERQPFYKIDVSNKNFILLDTFFYINEEKYFCWFLESYDANGIDRSNILFFNTNSKDFPEDEMSYEKDITGDLYPIFQMLKTTGYNSTGRVWINGIKTDSLNLKKIRIKNILWKKKR